MPVPDTASPLRVVQPVIIPRLLRPDSMSRNMDLPLPLEPSSASISPGAHRPYTPCQGGAGRDGGGIYARVKMRQPQCEFDSCTHAHSQGMYTPIGPYRYTM